jgi:hypothetical protein
MAAQSAAQSAWPRAKLRHIAISRVTCRGDFSRRKRCRVKNPVVMTVPWCAVQSGGGALSLAASDPGNGPVVDLAVGIPLTPRSNSRSLFTVTT